MSWFDCVEFCEKFSKLSGLKIQLPTEAQWEYACRAGTTTLFCNGTSVDDFMYASGVYPPLRVKEFSPNNWGLYDIDTNISEWCADWYSSNTTASTQRDPTGPKTGGARVLRGNGWFQRCPSHERDKKLPKEYSSTTGFRPIWVP